MQPFGLAWPDSWRATFGFAIVWLALMLAYSPLADWLATRWVAKPPTLGAFRALQQSQTKLILGIVVAWLLGAFVEELALRGVVLRWTETRLAVGFGTVLAAPGAIVVAALVAGLLHFYQGWRAALIITQLSVLFGVLYVISGHNLWAVILCHGFYDTIAFIRFAQRKSKYANLEADARDTGRPHDWGVGGT